MFSRAVRYGQIINALPFIRMVALTGSLALLNNDEASDLDYMLVAATGRVWLARLFTLIFGRYTRAVGFSLCPNVIISNRHLSWRSRDLYLAREICQMVPIAGMEVYAQLRQVNNWTESFLPNASGFPRPAAAWMDAVSKRNITPRRNTIDITSEYLLGGSIGDHLEAWEMHRKVERFSHQAGFGNETVFNSEICQGNFDHHGALTRKAYERKLRNLGLDSCSTRSPQQSAPPDAASTGDKGR